MQGGTHDLDTELGDFARISTLWTVRENHRRWPHVTYLQVLWARDTGRDASIPRVASLSLQTISSKLCQANCRNGESCGGIVYPPLSRISDIFIGFE
jgi:hypothetical protein